MLKNLENLKNKFLPICLFLILTLISSLSVKAVSVASDWQFIPNNIATTATFRLLFVTSNRTQATNSDIEYYNNFVQNAARRNPALAIFANEFKVLGSTSVTNARDNTNTNVNTDGTGVPIYFLGGHKLANNYGSSSFYGINGWILPTADFPQHPNHVGDGSFYQYNELGNIVEPSTTARDAEHRVWTGSNRSGLKTNNAFGFDNVQHGYNEQTSEINVSDRANTDEYRLYGLSPLISIDTNLPTYMLDEINIKETDFVTVGENYIPNAEINNNIFPVSFVGVTPSFDTNSLGGPFAVTYTISDSEGTASKTLNGKVYVVNKNKLDIDSSGRARANQDGLMIRNYIANNRNIKNYNLIAKNAVIKSATDVLAYLDFIRDDLDVDLNGEINKNDMQMILRFLFGVRGNVLAGGLTLSGSRNIKEIRQYLIDISNPPTWREVTENADWLVRSEHSSVVFDRKMWVLGGEAIGDYFNDVWYSTNGKDWTLQTAPSWPRRHKHSSVVFNGKMWVLGGYDSSRGYFNDVWSYDRVTWAQATATAAWSKRRDHSSVVFKNKIWVLGGEGNVNSANYNDVWSSADGVSWTRVATAAWSARRNHSSVVFKDKMWVLGGFVNGKSSNDVWSSEDGETWTHEATAAWPARSQHSSVVFRDKIWVLNGDRNSFAFLNDVWYSNDGKNWTQTIPPRLERARHSSVVFKNKIWILGGELEIDTINDVWSFGNQ